MRWWWVIKEFDGANPAFLHFIKIPSIGEKGFYRSILSIEAFRDRQGKHIQKCNKKRKRYGRWFYVVRFDEYLIDKRGWRRSFDGHGIERLPSEPYRKYNSIWDFYAAVRYDYKRRRFLP